MGEWRVPSKEDEWGGCVMRKRSDGGGEGMELRGGVQEPASKRTQDHCLHGGARLGGTAWRGGHRGAVL